MKWPRATALAAATLGMTAASMTAALAAATVPGGTVASSAIRHHIARPTTSAQTIAPKSQAPAGYAVLGQPDLGAVTTASRCRGKQARFSSTGSKSGAPTDPGIAIGPGGRLFVSDPAGNRIMSWPDADSLDRCQAADEIIGKGDLNDPGAIAVDGNGWLYVAEPSENAVEIFKPGSSGYVPSVTLGHAGSPGSDSSHLDDPSAVAIDESGNVYVADTGNNRVLVFDPPLTSGEAAADSIGAGDNGGLSKPTGLAIHGDEVFVADTGNDRVLRFTGPFETPNKVYPATGSFTGVSRPTALAVGSNNALYVGEAATASSGAAVASYRNSTISGDRARPDWTIAAHSPTVTGISVDPTGRLFINDPLQYRVVIRKGKSQLLPSDPDASAATRALLKQFQDRLGRATHRIAIGQEMATWDTDGSPDDSWYRDFADLAARNLPTPLIMSSELSFLPPLGSNSAALQRMIAFAKAGGIVALDWHPDNPIAGGSYSTPDTTAQLKQITTAGTAANTAWRDQLSNAAATIRQFAAAGVPVILRPLVESNGTDYFWWADDGSVGMPHQQRIAAFVRLWNSVVSDMSNTQGLHNILYDYSTNSPQPYAGSVDGLDDYPGSHHVDLVGTDVYNVDLSMAGNSNRGLDAYQALVDTGKPFGFSEYGQGTNDSGGSAEGTSWDARTLIYRARDSYPAMTYAIDWYSSQGDDYSLADTSHVPALLRNRLIQTLPG